MAIVKKMIDKMGGTISVTSEVGKGSTFVVELPFEMGAAPEKSKKEEADKENSIHGLNLMLVEDNELNAEVAEILLEDEGAIITMVNDGQQAVELFNNNPVGSEKNESCISPPRRGGGRENVRFEIYLYWLSQWLCDHSLL